MGRLIPRINLFIKLDLVVLFFLTVIILPTVTFLFRRGFFPMYDDMQVVRLWQMDKCIKDFQIPCRWVPDLGLGYGYPLFIFYAPLPYYLMEIVHLFGFSFINSVKLGFILSIFFSGVFFYLFARNFFNKTASLFVSFLYVYIPFRAASIYVRGAMGEAWGLAIIPFLFWGFENYLKNKGLKSGIIFSFTLATFLITHNLSVFMFLPFFIFWILLRIYIAKVNFFYIKKIIGFGLLGIGLSCFYLIPVIFERNLVHLETLTSGYFGYLQHFISLKQIFYSSKWGYGPSIPGPNDEVFLGIGPIHSFVALAGFISSIIAYRKKKVCLIFSIFLSAGFLFSAYLSHSRSTPLWQVFKFMEILQFPWRFIMVASFIASFLAGYLFEIFSKRLSLFFGFIIMIVTLGMYGNFFKPRVWFYITDSEKLSGESLKRQLTASIYDFLPKTATRAPDEVASSDLLQIKGEIETLEKRKGSNWFYYKVDVRSNNSTMAIPAYSFPHWKVRVNKDFVRTSPYGDLGSPSFSLENGIYTISAKLTKTLARIIGDVLSASSLLILLFLFYNDKKTRKINK